MTAILLLLGRHDERALHAVVLCRRTLVDRAMCTVTHLGDAWLVIGLVVALCLGGAPGLERTGLQAGLILAFSHLWVQLLKRTVTRPRPQLPPGCARLIEAPDRFSFPSGHAAASLSLAIPIAAAVPGPAAAAVLVLAALVGFSRCYLGVHYPGDVIAGWLLAVITSGVVGPTMVLLTG